MNRDRFVALCCLMIGLLISIGSIRLGLGNIRNPQAGLFPFLLGLVIILISIILFKERRQGKRIPILGERWKNLLFVLGSIIFYSLALDWFGYPITTFIFMIVILKAIEPQKWSIVLIIAILSTFSAYLLFSLWLKLEFPKGIIGF